MYPLSDIKLARVGIGYVGLPLPVEFGWIRTVMDFDIHSLVWPISWRSRTTPTNGLPDAITALMRP